ncbi:MAG: hypothetical protein KAT79_07385, partial [candidate division Zixibacteria bacterium]|nr:hypothetical protein [candidate division Zixibacteria bacterium]
MGKSRFGIVVASLLTVGIAANLNGGSSSPGQPGTTGKIDRISISKSGQTAEIVSGKIATTGLTRSESALNFVQSQPDLYQLKSPAEELQLKSDRTDNLGMSHLRYDQTYRGLRVRGCQTIVHFDPDGDIYLVGGQTIPTPTISTDPAVTQTTALGNASATLREQIGNTEFDSDAELIIFPDDGHPTLSWQITLTCLQAPPFRWRVFVDALTGDVLHYFNDLPGDDYPCVGSGIGVTGDTLGLEMCMIAGKYRLVDATRPMFQLPIRDYEGTINTYYERDIAP